jgi:hypothetical protein
MSFDFADAAPVKTTGGGRKAADNPFTEVVSAIALKVDDKGKPLAKAFTLNHENTDEDRKKSIEKVKRQLSTAGEKNDPQVTVMSNATPVQVKGKDSATVTVITFWTVKRQIRPRKPAEATASV